MKIVHFALLFGAGALFLLLTSRVAVNTDSMMELADAEADYKLLCRDEYRIEYEKKGDFRTVAIGSAPDDLAPLCEQRIRVEAKPRFFYGRPLCSPNARPGCEKKFTLVVDVAKISPK
jgi:hypothetical protein